MRGSPSTSKSRAGRRKGGQLALEFLHPFRMSVLTCLTPGKAASSSLPVPRECQGIQRGLAAPEGPGHVQLPWLWGRELHERGMPWHVAACPAGGGAGRECRGAPLQEGEGNGFVPLVQLQLLWFL